MGASKTEGYSEAQIKLADIARALGHPARIAIMDYLLRVNACVCNDIVDELPLAQPTVSQHLKALREAGLIRGSVEGNSICYCIEPTTAALLASYLHLLQEHAVKLKNNSCC